MGADSETRRNKPNGFPDRNSEHGRTSNEPCTVIIPASKRTCAQTFQSAIAQIRHRDLNQQQDLIG